MDVVGVRFPESAKIGSCDPAGLALEVGDGCVVETDRGPVFGVVVRAVLSNPYQSGKLPRVLRRATVEDEESFARKSASEREAREFCLAKIRERRIPMKLGQVEQQQDGKRLLFHFTAESRVDFRELVRDLSAKFRARIELRQIGARDDASMQGGCGPCGKQLCCSTFLRGFEPVSIKMAKAQGLSLNPSKISGMCGRLMCCLKYEYEPGAKGQGSAKRD